MIAYHAYLIVCCILCNSYAFAMKKETANPNIIGEMMSKDSKNRQTDRDGKIFSLFSIVQFKNQGCRSSQTLSNTIGTIARNGTCYSSTECTSKAGTAAGGCAAGFGVCCVFVYETSGGTITQNCSYIRNPNYPSALTDTSAIAFTVAKCDASVCFLRLDFESFDTYGLTGTDENTTPFTASTTAVTCQDTFTITSTNDPNLPTICGSNQGQHVYVDLGTQSSDTATLAFAFSGTYSRLYEIKVTQLPCTSEYGRMPGCFQYYEGLTGRVESFNFPNCVTQGHLPSQDYNVCVRPQAGYDCINWQICMDTTCGAGATAAPGGSVILPAAGSVAATNPCTAFSPGMDVIGVIMAGQDTDCTRDYIRINGGSNPCCQGTAPFISPDRYCGYFLGVDPLIGDNMNICDCVAPYELEIYFDTLNDLTIAGAQTTTSCGICLEYTQTRC